MSDFVEFNFLISMHLKVKIASPEKKDEQQQNVETAATLEKKEEVAPNEQHKEHMGKRKY